MRLTPEATTPLEDALPKRKPQSKSAAGLPAIISTAKHGLSKMGLIGSLTNFYKVNKARSRSFSTLTLFKFF